MHGMCLWKSIGCLVLLPLSAMAGERYALVETIPSPQATQAAAADERFVYAVSSKAIAKIDRATGKEIALSTGEASHLNSAFISDGKVYCAHSNFPKTPEQGDIRVLDPDTMKLEIFHRFENPPGSVTWVLKRGDVWWCHFARYGTENAKSVLVRYDADWKETNRWGFPAELVKEWGVMSLSGGIWEDDRLLVTGHDKRSVYRLELPQDGTTMRWTATLDSPFPGQGIAWDPKTKGLVGIDRKKKAVVFAKLETVAP